MKRKINILITFMLALAFLSGCKKDKDSAKADKEIVNAVSNENESNEENSSDNKNKENIADKLASKIKGKESNKVKEAGKNIDKTSNELASNLNQVEGARMGSVSSYVEDREVWNEFLDEKYMDAAKKYENGIHLPRILLDSDDAKVANEEIDAIVQNMKEIYDANKEYLIGNDAGIVASFSVYQDDNILSLMIENYDTWNGENIDHHIFNFSLPDGKFIDSDELMKEFNLDKDSILTLVENGLIKKANFVTEAYCRDVTDISYTDNPDNLIGLMLNDLWDNYNLESRKLFIDEVGRPSYIFDDYDVSNVGQGPLVFELESDRFERSLYYDDYIRMARALGLNPYDEDNRAFVIYLGGANDEDNLIAALSKLQVYSDVFSNYEDPSMLVAIKQSEGGDMPYLIGEQCYLVIPKYKNASVSLKELEITQDGKLQEVENHYLDYNACSGPTLICQNMSDIGPNAKIIIRYRDEVVEFSPQLSGKDGSLMLPDGVLDGEGAINWQNEVQDGFYSYIIFERIKNLMGVG